MWNYPLKLASFGFWNDQNQKASKGSASGTPQAPVGPTYLSGRSGVARAFPDGRAAAPRGPK